MKGRDPSNRRAGARASLGLGLAAAVALGGCADLPDAAVDVTPGSGSVALTLAGNPAIHVDSVAYTLDRANYHQTGSLSVGHSGGLSAILSPVPAGAAYTLDLSATNVAGESPRVTCAGSTTFDVIAGQTASAMVNLRCQEESVTPPRPAAVPFSSPTTRSALVLTLLALGAVLSRRRRV